VDSDDVMDLTPRRAPTLQGTLEKLAADEVFVDYLCRVVCHAVDRGVTSNSGLRSVMTEKRSVTRRWSAESGQQALLSPASTSANANCDRAGATADARP
jgi:hypothetical protein